MSVLGIDTMHETPSGKKSRWNMVTTVVLGLLIALFSWIVISNMYLLYFGKPLIQH
jgi:hypothetical protein